MGDWILYATRTTLKSCEGTTGAKDILVILDGPDKCSDRCIIDTRFELDDLFLFEKSNILTIIYPYLGY